MPSVLGATHGGWVHMVNVTTRDGFDRSTSGRLSSWAKNQLSEAALGAGVTGLRCERYRGLTVTGADAVRPNERAEMTGVPVYGELDDGTAFRNDKLRTSRASPACGRSTVGRT